jgi:hypothetical protein
MSDLGSFQITALAGSSRSIAAAARGVLSWEWDPVFGASLCAFDEEHVEAIRTTLDEVMSSRFSGDTISDAPDSVRAIARGHGGLRPGQELWILTGDHPLLYCAWWPWGSGTRVSARVGIVSSDQLSDASAERALRSWFGIEAPA